MRILVVEDEKKIGEYIRKGLTENGFNVDLASDGQTGSHLACGSDYSLVILDVMLPNQNGWSIIAQIRQQGKQIPVLFLTARDAVADRVRGLELGADDYLVKPFAFSELLARVRALLRRGPARPVEKFCIEDLEIDLRRHKAIRSGKVLDLTPKEFSLLVFLTQRAGEVQSRVLIAEQVWDMNFDSDTNVVDVAIGRLRKKVDEGFSIPLIHTIRGIGYVVEKRPI